MRTWRATGIAAVALCVWSATAVAQQVAPLAPAPGVAGAAPAVVPPPAVPAGQIVASPPSASASPPVRVPLVRRWWFWASLGAAAVGVVVAGIMLSPPRPYTGNAEPGQTSPF